MGRRTYTYRHTHTDKAAAVVIDKHDDDQPQQQQKNEEKKNGREIENKRNE